MDSDWIQIGFRLDSDWLRVGFGLDSEWIQIGFRLDSDWPRATYDRNKVWVVHPDLNTDNMKLAAERLIGKHDFSTFRAAACQAKSPIKNWMNFGWLLRIYPLEANP